MRLLGWIGGAVVVVGAVSVMLGIATPPGTYTAIVGGFILTAIGSAIWWKGKEKK
mgnify:CR=1 FL=1